MIPLEADVGSKVTELLSKFPEGLTLNPLQSEAKRLADEIAQREPYVTALFNNAGILNCNCRPAITNDVFATVIARTLMLVWC